MEEPFRLLETLLWRPKSGFFLKARHRQRLLDSAHFFGWDLDPDHLSSALEEAARHCHSFQPVVRHRVRLLADPDGSFDWQATPFPCSGRQVWTVRLDDRPVDSQDLFLRHKTTHRQIYEQALARHACDDVLLWNERGELTESTRANLVLDLEGRWLTPRATSGLLPGTYRAELLERGRLQEATLRVDTLSQARKILLINSVRGFLGVEWLP